MPADHPSTRTPLYLFERLCICPPTSWRNRNCIVLYCIVYYCTKRSCASRTWAPSAWPWDLSPVSTAAGCRYTSASTINCAVNHDAFCSSWNVPGVSRRHSFRHRWQPDTTWSALRRQHVVLATEMYVHDSMGERAFSFSGPLAGNALPSTLRDIANRTRLRELLETHLFNSVNLLPDPVFNNACLAWTLCKAGNKTSCIIISTCR